MQQQQKQLQSTEHLLDTTHQRRVRWFAAFLALLLLLATLVVPALVFLLTKNLFSLGLYSALAILGLIFRPFVRYVFPLTKEEMAYRTKMAEIRYTALRSVVGKKRTDAKESHYRKKDNISQFPRDEIEELYEDD